ncbi:hypothetical protein [Nostoc sp. KVJ20]|uniref:hypothetical protein n=1 Tax=Nostoc sp. KVJ20 TaxID=457944 RepID=UPI00114CF498|nr:hypothetical protein [Nostoc sp. KVJ20]
MKILDHKDSIIYHKDAMNRRLYKRPIIVETAIYRVFCLNRTVLGGRRQKILPQLVGDSNLS